MRHSDNIGTMTDFGLSSNGQPGSVFVCPKTFKTTEYAREDYTDRNSHHPHYTRAALKAQRKERYIINTNHANQTSDSNYTYVTRRIGSTTYKVKVVFCDSGKETMEDKVLRMIQNEVLERTPECGNMDLPQMSRQSERSA